MADEDYIDQPTDTSSDAPVGTAGDFGKTLGAGALDIGSSLAAISRYAFEQGGSQHGADISAALQNMFGGSAEDVRDTMNPETRKLASSALTSPEFLSHPILGAALKATGMVPAVAALAIPGGLLADTVGATIAATAGGAAINAGSGLDEFYKKLDAMPDADLQAQSTKYKALRQVLDEKSARAKFNAEAQSWGPAINAIIGAAAAGVGPAGIAARAVAGGGKAAVAGATDSGVLGRAGIAAGEGALGNAAQAGVGDLTSQNADINAGLQKEFDTARTANAALEGGALGGFMGGAVGLVAGGGAKTPAVADIAKPVEPKTAPADVDVAASTAQPQTGRASAAPAKPPEDANVGNPQNEPTRSSRDGAKGKGKGKSSTTPPKENAAAAPVQVDPAVAQAVGAANPATGASATEHAALTQGSPNETIDKLNAAEAATPQGNAAPAAPLDTGQNVSEKPQSIQEQIAQIGTGNRKAVMMPKGTTVPAAFLGGRTDLVSMNTPRGRFIFDPKLTNRGEITKLSNLGRENELLGLGPVSKPEAVARVVAGETPTAVTERTPDGTEVKAAAGTDQTAPDQARVLEANKTPGNTVSVETPGQVVAKRQNNTVEFTPWKDVGRGYSIRESTTHPVQEIRTRDGNVLTRGLDTNGKEYHEFEMGHNPMSAGGMTWVDQALSELKQMKQGGPKEPPTRAPRVLPNLTQTADTVPLSDFNRNKVEPPKEPNGKNYSAKEAAARDEKLAKAKTITDANTPGEHEINYLRDPEARNAVIRRAQAMVDAADKEGVKIQGQLKKSTKGDALSDHPSMQILRAAKDLAKVAAKRKAGREITEATGKFAEAERLIRAGHSDEVLATRKEEGDAANRRGSNSEDVAAAGTYTEEAPAAALDEGSAEAKPNANAVSKDDVTTSAAKSAKMGVRGIDDGTETTKEGVVRAKAASGEKLSADAKAKAIAEMNERLGLTPPKLKPAARKINLNPTEGQIRAGNYAKGHRNIEGLRFTIENPRGAVRRGVDEHGTPWEVRVPEDYGYIRGTKGADGDHIDAHDLRTGDKHFVVDQLDHRTGEFDEHKVMLRAKDEAHAVDTYTRAFSDGHGSDRLGNLHEVTMPELKEWADSADTTAPMTAHMMEQAGLGEKDFAEDSPFRRLMALTDAAKQDAERRRSVQLWDGEKYVRVKPYSSSTLAAELGKLDFRQSRGIAGVVGRMMKKELIRLAGNTEVHVVDRDQLSRVTGREAGNTAGLHAGDEKGLGHILLNIEHMKEGFGEGSTAHTLMHEAIHAISARELNSNKVFRDAVEHLAYTTARYMNDPANETRIALEYQGADLKYAFTDVHEFMSEALSNPSFQKLLSEIPAGREMERALSLGENRAASVWDMMRGFVKQLVFGRDVKGKRFESVLDGVMRVGEHIAIEHENTHATKYNRGVASKAPQDFVGVHARDIVQDATDRVKEYLGRDENNTPESAPKVLKLRTFDNIAKIADHYFGENNPVRKIHEAIERMRVTGQKIFERTEPVVRQLVGLRASNAEQFREFERLLHDATVANVHPDVPLSDAKNAHLGKSKVVGSAVWSKAQHADLAKRFRALPPDLQEAWHGVVKHFTDTQNEMSLGIINNQILKLMGINDAALGRRIHEGTLTDADRTALGSNLDTIEKASELSKIEGPYVPLMRRGDHVVKADIKVTQPGNAKKISSNEFEFKTDKEATDYAKSNDLRSTIKKVWVDKKTGELHEGEHRMTADDLDSEARYRVEVNNRHVEFVQGKRAADRRAVELSKDNSLDVHKVVPRAFEANGRQAPELSTALSNLAKKLEKSDAYKQATPTQKATMRSALGEAALASHGSTRVSSRALPRRNVAGHSEDIIQNTVDYGASSSRYLAKLEHGPALEAGLTQMQEQLDRDHSKTGQYARTAISNEVRQRVQGDNGFQQGGKLSPVIKRALSISFIDKLGSPAYSVINAMQPGMVTMPYLSGRHGVVRSFAALGKAYADINSFKIIKEGIKETGRRIAGKRAPEDFITSITKKLSPDERRMIDDHVQVGTIDPSAGMELNELVRDTSGVGGKIDAGLGYLEGVTREMPRAIEAINRATTAIAAYRLERARGATHEAAVQYSKDAVNSTQFNYSATNAPPIFNHPLLKIALQFKKYGQGMYQLIGSQIAQAIHNEKPGDRSSAVKTLIGIAATHTAIAGALGLPTEPFKYLLLGAHAAGLTGMQWGDVEDKIRHGAASVFGKTGGEVFSRGLPRLFNVDLSRAGLDTITSFGEPKSDKDSEVKSWLFDSLAGPVVSLGGDWIKGLNQIANGDFEKAAENLIPLKEASDSLRAYRQYTEGKKSATGKQTMTPYTPTEAALRVLGFGTGREAEGGAKASAYYRQKDRDTGQRSDLINSWAAAAPTAKTKAWAAIQQWNKDKPDEAKITPKQLTDKTKRDAKAAQTAVQGISPAKRDRRFLNEGSIYNTR